MPAAQPAATLLVSNAAVLRSRVPRELVEAGWV